MSVDDCFEFGRQAFNNKDYVQSAQWLEESRKRLNDHQMINTDVYVDTMSYLAHACYENGNQ